MRKFETEALASLSLFVQDGAAHGGCHITYAALACLRELVGTGWEIALPHRSKPV